MSLKGSYSFLKGLLFDKKPQGITWKDYFSIQALNIRYQPLVFPDGTVISKKCSDSIIDSRDKLSALRFPKDFIGKSFLDIGCAEGFFVIQAALRGAVSARGCDIIKRRIEIAKLIAKYWNFDKPIEFLNAGLYEIPSHWAADIVICLAVCHHLHGDREHDTWKIISNPKAHQKAFDNMLHAVKRVAELTKEITYWEYSYEYSENVDYVDYGRLGKIWEEKGFYRKVEFIGLSQRSPKKDRAIYHAYK